MNYFLSVLLMIGMAGAQQTIKMSNLAGGAQPVLVCESPDGTWVKSHDCKITTGHTLDEIVRSWADMVERGPAPKPVARKKVVNRAKINALTAMSGNGPQCVTGSDLIDGECKLILGDVPAIQETVPSYPEWVDQCNGGNICFGGTRTCSNNGHVAPNQGNIIDPKCEGGYIWTCADKSRILEHDEATPPKYWCRKVQN